MRHALPWLLRVNESLGEDLRAGAWHLREMQDHRGQIAGIWNDRCSQELGQRYLDPLGEDAQSALKGLGEGLAELMACHEAMTRAQAEFDQAQDLALRVEALRAETESLLRDVHARLDQAGVQLTLCSSQLAQAAARLAQAEAV